MGRILSDERVVTFEEQIATHGGWAEGRSGPSWPGPPMSPPFH